MIPWNRFLEKPYVICAIDPGTDTLGVSILYVDLLEGTITLVDAFTWDASKYIEANHHQTLLWGPRFARIAYHRNNLYELLIRYQPNLVVAESPFMGRFPQAFESLVEVRSAISLALYSYNPALPLELMDPPTAKKGVGAIVKKGSKENVQECVKALSDLIWQLPYPLEQLDEHCYDAIAVGYTTAKSVLRGYVYIAR